MLILSPTDLDARIELPTPKGLERGIRYLRHLFVWYQSCSDLQQAIGICRRLLEAETLCIILGESDGSISLWTQVQLPSAPRSLVA